MSFSTATQPAIGELAPAPVRLTRVSKSFTTQGHSVEVLRDIDLDVQPGEIVALLGPSGCGKSTLLRLVAGLDDPTSGQVLVDDHVVSGIDQRCSVVFQEPRLLPWRTVEMNVKLGVRSNEQVVEIPHWLNLVGLKGFGSYLPRQISGGMAQRTALARGLIGHPGVLLMDEPFAALDALTRMHMQDLLTDVVDRIGTTVLLVTHDIDEALYLADRIVVMGHRGEGIARTLDVTAPRPRDRSDPQVAPLRAELLTLFGVHS